MRDRLARAAASALLAAVVLLAAFFAHRQNRMRPTPVAEAPAPASTADLDTALVERGREVYGELYCSRCHGLGGRGNPRSPLDGVGSRLSRPEIRAWVTATEPARAALPGSAVRAKESRASELPASDLDALVEYLASLR